MKRTLPQFSIWLGTIVAIAGLLSCTKKQQVDAPAYLKIDSVAFQTIDSDEGTNRQKITEAWVYINDNLQGIYDLPCEVPLLVIGEKRVKIRGGVRRNGIEETHIDYPFFNTFEQTVTLEALKTQTLSPVLKYFDDAIVWDESFDDSGYKFEPASASDTSLFLTNDPAEVFEGTGSGKIVLSGNNQFARIHTTQKFQLPFGQPVFVEMHYKTNAEFSIGLVSHIVNTGETIYTNYLYLEPTIGNSRFENGWNKVYVNLSELVNKNTTAESSDIFFEMIRQDTNSSDAILLLDNVKLLYRN